MTQSNAHNTLIKIAAEDQEQLTPDGLKILYGIFVDAKDWLDGKVDPKSEDPRLEKRSDAHQFRTNNLQCPKCMKFSVVRKTTRLPPNIKNGHTRIELYCLECYWAAGYQRCASCYTLHPTISTLLCTKCGDDYCRSCLHGHDIKCSTENLGACEEDGDDEDSNGSEEDSHESDDEDCEKFGKEQSEAPKSVYDEIFGKGFPKQRIYEKSQPDHNKGNVHCKASKKRAKTNQDTCDESAIKKAK